MKLIVTPKTKRQEKAVEDFLSSCDIEFTKVEEDAAPYITRTKKTHSKKEKAILHDLQEAVEFVNKHKKGKVKAKSLKQLLDEL
jgi:Ethanolamine utilization protein EutJ (predicted chaperonin)